MEHWHQRLRKGVRLRPDRHEGATLLVRIVLTCVLALALCSPAASRELKSNVTELNQVPSVRPEFPVPKEPNMLFYIQRSVNSNTVVYAAQIDPTGKLDADHPVVAYWRWY